MGKYYGVTRYESSRTPLVSRSTLAVSATSTRCRLRSLVDEDHSQTHVVGTNPVPFLVSI